MRTVKTPAAALAELAGQPAVGYWRIGRSDVRIAALDRMDALTAALLVVNAAPETVFRAPSKEEAERVGDGHPLTGATITAPIARPRYNLVVVNEATKSRLTTSVEVDFGAPPHQKIVDVHPHDGSNMTPRPNCRNGPRSATSTARPRRCAG